MKGIHCPAAVMLACAIALAGCGTKEHGKAADGEFRSVIRLWPRHHLEDSTEAKLMEAFRKYPGACDEVWFCFENESGLSIEERTLRRSKMVKAAEDVRSLGIIASLQTITIGHPDGLTTGSDTNALGWRAMTGSDGARSYRQTCPRDTAFLNRTAWEHAFYAEKLLPENIYLDDDLRITAHSPVESLCFCDHCIAEFNSGHGYSFDRASLVRALEENEGEVRRDWISFSQESLAMVARAVSREVHKVSPQTHMGLQHVSFHGALLEGWDWNPMFRAMKEETGLAPVSRPGHGFYNDHSPRGMIGKAYGISRQIARLDSSVVLVNPEIEGYFHKATGKSPQSLCTETLLYLSMGANSMSYAIICSGQEPVEWYADNYFKALDRYHHLFSEYTAWNRGTLGGGIDSYISPEHFRRNASPGEGDFAWAWTSAGEELPELSPLGVPFTPEGGMTTATVLDRSAVLGVCDSELGALFSRTGVVMDRAALAEVEARGKQFFSPVPVPDGLADVECFESAAGRHIAVVPAFTGDVNNAQRLNTLRIYDWASDGRMAVILESMAQAVVVPRVAEDGSLRSVVLVNATISDLPSATLRLRGCRQGSRFSWNDVNGSRRLRPVRDGNDFIVTLPAVKAWDAGWIRIQ